MNLDQKHTAMFRCLSANENNVTRAIRMFAREHGDIQPQPGRASYYRLLGKVRQHGVLKVERRPRVRPVQDGALREPILHAITENRRLSLRALAHRFDISKDSVRRILRTSTRPFKPTKVQKLQNADAPRRIEFCEWGLAQLRRDPHFFRRVLFTDESTFTNNGPINKQTTKMWDDRNPHWILENDRQHRWKVQVWIGIVGDRIVGPIFYEGNLGARGFRRFLPNVMNRLQRNPVPRDRMWWQMDGAPPHNGGIVTDYLERMFPHRWIGLNSPHVRFPPRSPDLTMLDYYLFGNLKRIVYREPTTTSRNMKQRIRDACAAIRPGEIRKAREQLRKRFRLCINNEGGHIEQLVKYRDREEGARRRNR